MNATQNIVNALYAALRGEAIDEESFRDASAAAVKQDDMHQLGCEMLKALITHYQSGLLAQRAMLLAQMGSGANG